MVVPLSTEGKYKRYRVFLERAGNNLPFVCDNLAKAGLIVVTVNYRRIMRCLQR